jgi:hypothetical protein
MMELGRPFSAKKLVHPETITDLHRSVVQLALGHVRHTCLRVSSWSYSLFAGQSTAACNQTVAMSTTTDIALPFETHKIGLETKLP